VAIGGLTNVTGLLAQDLQEENVDECFAQHHAHIVNNLDQGLHYELSSKNGKTTGRVLQGVHHLTTKSRASQMIFHSKSEWC
jgi:hypothetical protein